MVQWSGFDAGGKSDLQMHRPGQQHPHRRTGRKTSPGTPGRGDGLDVQSVDRDSSGILFASLSTTSFAVVDRTHSGSPTASHSLDEMNIKGCSCNPRRTGGYHRRTLAIRTSTTSTLPVVRTTTIRRTPTASPPPMQCNLLILKSAAQAARSKT